MGDTLQWNVIASRQRRNLHNKHVDPANQDGGSGKACTTKMGNRHRDLRRVIQQIVSVFRIQNKKEMSLSICPLSCTCTCFFRNEIAARRSERGQLKLVVLGLWYCCDCSKNDRTRNKQLRLAIGCSALCPTTK